MPTETAFWLSGCTGVLIGLVVGSVCMRALWERHNGMMAKWLRYVIVKHLANHTEAFEMVQKVIHALEGTKHDA